MSGREWTEEQLQVADRIRELAGAGELHAWNELRAIEVCAEIAKHAHMFNAGARVETRWLRERDEARAALADAVKREREACAKECDAVAAIYAPQGCTSEEAAKRIRARTIEHATMDGNDKSPRQAPQPSAGGQGADSLTEERAYEIAREVLAPLAEQCGDADREAQRSLTELWRHVRALEKNMASAELGNLSSVASAPRCADDGADAPSVPPPRELDSGERWRKMLCQVHSLVLPNDSGRTFDAVIEEIERLKVCAKDDTRKPSVAVEECAREIHKAEWHDRFDPMPARYAEIIRKHFRDATVPGITAQPSKDPEVDWNPRRFDRNAPEMPSVAWKDAEGPLKEKDMSDAWYGGLQRADPNQTYRDVARRLNATLTSRGFSSITEEQTRDAFETKSERGTSPPFVLMANRLNAAVEARSKAGRA